MSWWICLAAGLLLLSGRSLSQAETPVKTLPVLHVAERQPAIPFHLDRSPTSLQRIASVRLFVALAGSQDWREALRQSPAKPHFQPAFSSDGTYWLAIRTVDQKGDLHPPGPLKPDLQVVVDTVAPFLNVHVERTPNGEYQTQVRASDAHLDLKSAKIDAEFLSSEGKVDSVPPHSVNSKPDEAGANFTAVWRQRAAQHCVVRVVIKDQAGNETRKQVDWQSPEEPKILLTQGVRELQTPVYPGAGELIFPVPDPIGPAIPPAPAPTKTGMDPANRPATLPPKLPGARPGQQLIPIPIDAPAPSQLDIARSELLLRAARNAVKLEDIAEAIKRLEELLLLDPAHWEARFEFAGLLIQENRLDEAMSQLQTLVERNPSVAAYRSALADLLIQQRQYEAARSELLWLIELPDEQTSAAVKLAKTYAWEKRYEEAVRIYDTYLKSRSNLKTSDQRELAQLLMTMNRTQDAVQLLLPLYERQQESAYDSAFAEPLLADLILAYTRLLQRTTAFVYIDKLRESKIEQPGLWLKLADQLYLERAYVEALAIFQMIPRGSSDYIEAKLGAARSHLRLYETTMAWQILQELRAEQAQHVLYYSTVEADYHIVVGDWAKAIAIAQQRLRDNAYDAEAMLLLGDAYHASQQYLKAREVYTQAYAASEDTEEVELLLAQNLFQQRLFGETEAALVALLAKRPENIGARLLLIQTLRESKRFAEADQLARPRPTDIDPRKQLSLRTELGYVLLEQGRFSEASREFESLLNLPDSTTPDVAYGFYRANKALDQIQTARAALLMGPTPTSPPAEWAMILAGRAMADCDCPLAGEVMDQFLQLVPNHLAGLNLRGEAAHQCDCGCCNGVDKTGCDLECSSGSCGPDSAAFFLMVLDQSPENIRARLGLARSLVKHHHFEEALVEYRRLIEYQPDNINIRRELGRMMDGWKGIEHAEQWYASPFGFENSAAPLFGGGGTCPAPGVGGGPIRMLAGTTFTEETHVQSNELMATEYQAKYFRGWRNRQSAPLYQGLIVKEPTNEEAYFDLGQVYAGMGHTRCAIDAYRRLLEVNPCHAQAWQAYQRLNLELRPKVLADFDYLNQNGRDGLADIRWARPSISALFPLGDANEYFQIGYRHMILRPTDDRVDHGEVGFLRLQEKLTADWLFFGEVDVEEYDYGFKTRPTFATGTQYTFGNDAVIRGIGFLNNVIQNGESIRQDIYRAGVQVEGSWKPLRRWELSGFYRWADYSDDNTLNEFGLGGAYQILRGRRQLRGLVDFNFMTYAEQSIFPPSGFGTVGTVHPYFAPDSFSFTSAGLEWKHWLSCDNFQGADQTWYQVYLGGRFDSQSESYFLFRGEMLKDVRSWLTLSAQASVIESEVYDEKSVSAHAIIRFP